MTCGTYTVILAGPIRTFKDGKVSVTHGVWVRTLPTPFDEKVDSVWVSNALGANKQSVPDVLAIAMQYIKGASKIVEGNLQIAGDAAYGPKTKGGTREEGSDFHDYLGIKWTYHDGFIDKPKASQLHCLDCSGFMRMVWGYRHHMAGSGYEDRIPLCLYPRPDRSAMPRRAFQILDAAPGVIIVRDIRRQLSDFSGLGIGDLVFFDADDSDGALIDHIGMYLGLDTVKHYRFISSRKVANGATLRDYNYKGKFVPSILDGTELYARTFRAIRRL